MSNQILVVEDDPKLLKNLIGPLEDEDYMVMGATNVEDALSLSKEFKFELLITDVRLPNGMDGVDGYNVLKRHNEGLKCIVITGYADSNASLRAIKSQVHDWIYKPVDLDDLLSTTDRVLNPKTLADRLYRSFTSLPDKILSSTADLFRLDKNSSLKSARKKAFSALLTAIKSHFIAVRSANFYYSKLCGNEIKYLNLLATSDAEGSKQLAQEYNDLFEFIQSTSQSRGQSLGKGTIPEQEFRHFYDAVKTRKVTLEHFEISPALRNHSEADFATSPNLLKLKKLMWG